MIASKVQSSVKIFGNVNMHIEWGWNRMRWKELGGDGVEWMNWAWVVGLVVHAES